MSCLASPVNGLIQVVSVLVDSGADGNFIYADLVSQLHLPSVPLQTPLEALAITGVPLSRITHVTPTVSEEEREPAEHKDPITTARTKVKRFSLICATLVPGNGLLPFRYLLLKEL
ncbi:hypothetical protein SKAU_G00268520 [Synaphobranchus kaupii]|uniref:Peptidase A2 domain-containing protein n=1 Tax=Synaphobranchus kaupii TaxID=118154 RepID=A0A9Q1EZV6_SYNKA|nr:hypothetical protein SKAU_G00268520 [Synaphobranchus kaupii]